MRARVPVDDSFLDQGQEPIADVGQVGGGELLGYLFALLLLQEVLEVVVAELLDDVVVVGAHEHIEETYNVGRLEFGHDLDLGLHGRFQVRVFAY